MCEAASGPSQHKGLSPFCDSNLASDCGIRICAFGGGRDRSRFLGRLLVHKPRSTDARSAGAEVLILLCVVSLLPHKVALSN